MSQKSYYLRSSRPHNNKNHTEGLATRQLREYLHQRSMSQSLGDLSHTLSNSHISRSPAIAQMAVSNTSTPSLLSSGEQEIVFAGSVAKPKEASINQGEVNQVSQRSVLISCGHTPDANRHSNNKSTYSVMDKNLSTSAAVGGQINSQVNPFRRQVEICSGNRLKVSFFPNVNCNNLLNENIKRLVVNNDNNSNLNESYDNVENKQVNLESARKTLESISNKNNVTVNCSSPNRIKDVREKYSVRRISNNNFNNNNLPNDLISFDDEYNQALNACEGRPEVQAGFQLGGVLNSTSCPQGQNGVTKSRHQCAIVPGDVITHVQTAEQSRACLGTRKDGGNTDSPPPSVIFKSPRLRHGTQQRGASYMSTSEYEDIQHVKSVSHGPKILPRNLEGCSESEEEALTLTREEREEILERRREKLMQKDIEKTTGIEETGKVNSGNRKEPFLNFGIEKIQWRPEEANKGQLKENQEILQTLTDNLKAITRHIVGDSKNRVAPAPSFYYCGKDEERPSSFLQKLENYFITYNIKEEDKITVARQALRGEAKEWCERLFNASTPYTLFIGHFINTYDGVATRARITKRLYSEIQGKQEPAFSFIARKINLYQRIAPETDVNLQANIIKEQLLPKVRVHLRNIQVQDVHHLIDIVTALERDIVDLEEETRQRMSRLTSERNQNRQEPTSRTNVEQRRPQNNQSSQSQDNPASLLNRRERFARTCFNCSGDHYARDCPLPRQPRGENAQNNGAVPRRPRNMEPEEATNSPTRPRMNTIRSDTNPRIWNARVKSLFNNQPLITEGNTPPLEFDGLAKRIDKIDHQIEEKQLNGMAGNSSEEASNTCELSITQPERKKEQLKERLQMNRISTLLERYTREWEEKELPRIPILIGNKTVLALVDTGANCNFISSKLTQPDRGRSKQVTLACTETEVLSSGTIDVSFLINDHAQEAEMMVIPNLVECAILGYPWLKTEKVIIDYERRCIYYGSKERHTIFWYSGPMQVNQNKWIEELSIGMPEDYRQRYLQVLKDFHEVFDDSPQQTVTRTTKHEIRLKDDVPVRVKQYKLPETKKRIINDEVRLMLERGVISPSNSSYNSPVLLVPKKDGNWRICVDFRQLNAKTIVETSHLPAITDLIKELGPAKVFTKLDLKSGYWQLPMSRDCRKFTAFTTPDGASYEFNVMPFGLAGAPGSFQKLMVEVLGGYIHNFCKCYLDDVIIYSDSYEEHLQHLSQVLERLQVYGLKCAPDKCNIGVDHIAYLGYNITSSTNYPLQDHLRKIQEHPAPRTIKELRGFMGLANWIRDHIPEFAELATPLTNLLSIKRKFKWDQSAQQAFEKIKVALLKPLPLYRPIPGKRFYLQTDASGIGMGAVLYQLANDNKDRRVIACASAKLTTAERKYHVNEVEVLASLWAMKRFRSLLEGQEFTLRTDSRALLWLSKYKDDRAKLTRWSLQLEEFTFTVEHVPGKLNQLPDYLSRNPLEEAEEERVVDDRISPKLNLLEEQGNPLFLEVLQQQQQCDVYVQDMQAIRAMQQEGAHTASEREIIKEFEVIEDVIWHKEVDGRNTLFVPENMRGRVLTEYHESRLAAHPGRDETLRAIRKKYYWPRMKKHVKGFVRGCMICASTKSGAIQGAAPLRPRPPKEPWEVISVDILGPYPLTRMGNRYAIIATDLLSKWVEIKPVKNSTTKTVIRFIEEEVCARWGYPKTIITDNGPQFRSRQWENFARMGHIQPYTAPIYHQRANPVERRVQELKKILRTKEPRDQWDVHIYEALFALRTRSNASIGTSPSELLLGYTLPRPGEWCVPERCQHRRIPRRERIQNTKVIQTEYQERVFPEKRDAPTQFEEGESVMVRVHVQGNPFSDVWSGPHLIIRKLGDNTYEVDRNDSQQIIHVDDLRKRPTPYV